jgi:hypothetical protein
MSQPLSAPAEPAADQPVPRASRPGLSAAAVDAVITLVWFVVAGLVGAWLWTRVVTLPVVTKSGDSGTLSPLELTKQVGIDGWFFVIAAVAGLLSGALLVSWRRRDPLVMVVLVVLGAGLASWLMVHVGLALGPEKELTALRGVADGGHVKMQLKLQATGMAWVWPITAALGSLVHTWILSKPEPTET